MTAIAFRKKAGAQRKKKSRMSKKEFATHFWGCIGGSFSLTGEHRGSLAMAEGLQEIFSEVSKRDLRLRAPDREGFTGFEHKKK